MQQLGSKYFARRHIPLTLEVKGQNSTFSKNGYIAYQIKDNHKSSSMVENVLPADPTHPDLPDPGGGDKRSTFNFFQTTVMLHIKLKGIMNVATW